MACINFKCQNPCEGYTCQGNTPCVVENHKAVCKFCPPGFVTDTNYGCLEGQNKINIEITKIQNNSKVVCNLVEKNLI